MDQSQETDQRFIELETKVAFIERMVGELDGVVRTLSTDLDELRKEVVRLREADEARREAPHLEQPPHY